MERKEQKVGVGVGAFHNPPRAQYSEETRNVIKLLMEESKVSMMQRRSIQRAVDRGESLPPPSRATSATVDNKRINTSSSYWKKRSHEAIVNSGAYDREQYRRTVPLLNKEKQKRHLACMMAFGKDMPATPRGPRILHKARREPRLPDDIDPLNDLVQGIRERIEFLNDMEQLGLGKKYRPIIHQEIAEKIRIIESMDCRKSAEIESEIVGLKYNRPSPKPFPMGELDDS
ncbi:hypothetical protein PV328_007228 [Microctonus aethiopoides]|uniref:Uncharacterized protein n=1 Tax=Microctonus aethiopoides TaxID=144406 RepID=A0AA39KUD8_9HYME|nr:hypothetical protein PV328_007228 [Microctonus aethiopoides]